jgi:transposase
MVKPYSVDLRDRVVARVLAGGHVRAVAEAFSVSAASVVRWSQRWRSRGNAEPDKMGGHRRHVLDEERSWLMGRIEEEADVTLRQLMAELAERGVVVCYGTVWNFVHREGLSFKKKRTAQRAGPSRRRASPGALEKISSQA